MTSALLGWLLLADVAPPTPTRAEYVFPVQPESQASFQQGGHAYPAIDIFAPAGTRFVAPVDGIVEASSFVDEYDPHLPDPARFGGIWVSILGRDGFRYYGSHLAGLTQEMVPGRQVAAGDYLGDVGATGNARGKPIHLHFGITASARPFLWEVRRGEIEPFEFLRCLRKRRCNPQAVLEALAKSKPAH